MRATSTARVWVARTRSPFPVARRRAVLSKEKSGTILRAKRVKEDTRTDESNQNTTANAGLRSNANVGTHEDESGSVLGSAALIAGTTVGTGVLALPEITGPSGFVPSSEVLVAMWIYFMRLDFA